MVWLVVRAETIGVLVPQGQVVRPNSTCPLAGSLVVQLMLAAKGVRLVTVTEEIYGAMVSVPMGVGVGLIIVPLNVLNVL